MDIDDAYMGYINVYKICIIKVSLVKLKRSSRAMPEFDQAYGAELSAQPQSAKHLVLSYLITLMIKQFSK